jgi:hypothetical protein
MISLSSSLKFSFKQGYGNMAVADYEGYESGWRGVLVDKFL